MVFFNTNALKTKVRHFEFKKLSAEDGKDVFELLQEIPSDENGFINNCNGKTFDEFKQWLVASECISNGIGLEEWQVPQNVYWLYVDGIPVGMGKLRHYLTEKLKIEGGHMGYAIRLSERNQGFGKQLISLLIEEAKKLKIDRLLLTVQNHNLASVKAALCNGGHIEKADEFRHYIWIDV